MESVLSDELFGFAPPPFEPDEALLQVKRSLRDLKLTERGGGFELRGKTVLTLQVNGAQIDARLARRLALTPEWDKLTVANAADVRKLLDEIKKRLARFDRED
jgi:hypothetical protein